MQLAALVEFIDQGYAFWYPLWGVTNGAIFAYAGCQGPVEGNPMAICVLVSGILNFSLSRKEVRDDCTELEDHCDMMGLFTVLCIVRFVLILICLITACMGLCCFTAPQAAMQPQLQMQAVVQTGQVVTQGQPVQAVVMAPAQAVPMEQPMAKAP